MSLEEMLKQAQDYTQDQKKYGYEITYPGMEYGKNRKNFLNIIKRLKQVQLPDPSTFKYTSLSLSELKEYLSSILNKIFDREFNTEITSFNRMITLESIPNCFDSVLESEVYNGVSIPKKIHISNKIKSIQVASTAHEYMHALLSPYVTYSFNQVLSNYHYKELLSILTEYVTIYEISEILKLDDLQHKHEIIRLHNDQDNIKANEENKGLISTLEMMNFSPFVIEGIKTCVEYGEHNAYGYVLSDIYAYRLFYFYKDDPKKLLTIWKSIIHGEKSIQELLDYYGISLRDQETSLGFQKRLEKAVMK